MVISAGRIGLASLVGVEPGVPLRVPAEPLGKLVARRGPGVVGREPVEPEWGAGGGGEAGEDPGLWSAS